jgi:hypothetical protein
MTRQIRLIGVREDWGIYCGAVAVNDLQALPDKSANRVRVMIRRSPWPGFLVDDLTDLADQANRNGLTALPISIYRPGQHKGQRWQHSTLITA